MTISPLLIVCINSIDSEAVSSNGLRHHCKDITGFGCLITTFGHDRYKIFDHPIKGYSRQL